MDECYVSGSIYGTREQLKALDEAYQLVMSEENREKAVRTIFPDIPWSKDVLEMCRSRWLGFLTFYAHQTKEATEKIDSRGWMDEWDCRVLGEDDIYFAFLSAWNCKIEPLVDFIEAVLGPMEKTGVKITFQAEETNNGYFVTNDPDLVGCFNCDGVDCWAASPEAVLEAINYRRGTNFTSLDDDGVSELDDILIEGPFEEVDWRELLLPEDERRAMLAYGAEKRKTGGKL